MVSSFGSKLLPCLALSLSATACTGTGEFSDDEDLNVSERPFDSLSELIDPDSSDSQIVFRSIDGMFNNTQHPTWGSVDQPLLRMTFADYGDGLDTPAGASRPSARHVSNVVVAQEGVRFNPQGASDFLWAWGQFLDHDLDLSEAAAPTEAFHIPVPAGDPFFDPTGTGTQVIPLARTIYEHDAAMVRQQLNEITAYIDASNVYGSDEVRATALRTNDGTGRLQVSTGDLLPFNTAGLPNAALPGMDPGDLFLAGDVRANEVVTLAALHTLFVREHNRLADAFHAEFPTASGDELYEAARMLVGAELQVITYNEFLPVLLGSELPPYQGYDPTVDAGVTNEFSTAGYRVGHTMLASVIRRVDAQGLPIPEGPLALRDAFFAPSQLVATGLDPVLRGLATQRAQEIDAMVVDDVRNFLFGPPGSGGFDLPSLNIQRGRDHGLPGYNATRVALGLPAAVTFADITTDPVQAQRLSDAYGTPDAVDLWVGGLAEDPVPGGMVGELLAEILTSQFLTLRDGDRFWYQNSLSPALLAEVEGRTLAMIIRDNTGIGAELPDDVFLAQTPCVPIEVGSDDPIAIPDNDSNGIVSEIVVDNDGDINDVSISLAIDHTYRGDLRVTLVAPNGDEIVLHDQQGGSADDLVLDHVPLSSLAGEALAGTWTLHVQDELIGDVGSLQGWSLHFNEFCSCEEVGFADAPQVAIPDKGQVSSAIQVSTTAASVGAVYVDVDITHTYRGDLRVVLTDPDGNDHVLHNRTGGPADDLVLSSVPVPVPALVDGDWTLTVFDELSQDVGTLESWGIDLQACE